ncbi:MAG: universal stress protein [Actinobacteria bacterium]|nr:universal stress protein [Acidimicrobiia bacterium]MCA1735330.1 universal stress protein [Actinomycetota bacterium]
MTNRVVAGIDLSPIGRRVAERARLLADLHELPLHLVSVNESSSDAFLDDGLGRILAEHYQRNLVDVAKWIGARATVPITYQAIRGSIGWELVREAKKAAIVVVGTSAVDVERCGPIARRVAIMSSGDVLVVRRQPRNTYRKVLAAVDFSVHSETAVEAALRWCPQAELSAIFSLPDRWDTALVESGLFEVEVEAARSQRLRKAVERMEEYVARWPGKVKPLVVDGSPATSIDEVVRRRGVDLVVVANRGAGATKMILLGTVADGVLETMPCDVLVARVPGDFRRP